MLSNSNLILTTRAQRPMLQANVDSESEEQLLDHDETEFLINMS